MYAWVAVKAKVNRRDGADGAVVRIVAAQAVQALGQQRGGLRAPLCRRHARRVMKVGRCHEMPAVRQTSGQCPKSILSLYRSVA